MNSRGIKIKRRRPKKVIGSLKWKMYLIKCVIFLILYNFILIVFSLPVYPSPSPHLVPMGVTTLENVRQNEIARYIWLKLAAKIAFL